MKYDQKIDLHNILERCVLTVTAAMLVYQNKETAAMLVYQNKETAAMLVFQTIP